MVKGLGRRHLVAVAVLLAANVATLATSPPTAAQPRRSALFVQRCDTGIGPVKGVTYPTKGWPRRSGHLVFETLLDLCSTRRRRPENASHDTHHAERRAALR